MQCLEEAAKEAFNHLLLELLKIKMWQKSLFSQAKGDRERGDTKKTWAVEIQVLKDLAARTAFGRGKYTQTSPLRSAVEQEWCLWYTAIHGWNLSSNIPKRSPWVQGQQACWCTVDLHRLVPHWELREHISPNCEWSPNIHASLLQEGPSHLWYCHGHPVLQNSVHLVGAWAFPGMVCLAAHQAQISTHHLYQK